MAARSTSDLPKGALPRLLLAVLFALALGGGALAAGDAELAAFARRLGLADVAGFVDTIRTLDRTGRLPARYLT